MENNILTACEEMGKYLQTNNLQCPECKGRLRAMTLNSRELLVSCSNKYCVFPLNSESMTIFIVHIVNIQDSLEKIFNFLSVKKEETSAGTLSNSASVNYNKHSIDERDFFSFMNFG